MKTLNTYFKKVRHDFPILANAIIAVMAAGMSSCSQDEPAAINNTAPLNSTSSSTRYNANIASCEVLFNATSPNVYPQDPNARPFYTFTKSGEGKLNCSVTANPVNPADYGLSTKYATLWTADITINNTNMYASGKIKDRTDQGSDKAMFGGLALLSLGIEVKVINSGSEMTILPIEKDFSLKGGRFWRENFYADCPVEFTTSLNKQNGIMSALFDSSEFLKSNPRSNEPGTYIIPLHDNPVYHLIVDWKDNNIVKGKMVWVTGYDQSLAGKSVELEMSFKPAYEIGAGIPTMPNPIEDKDWSKHRYSQTKEVAPTFSGVTRNGAAISTLKFGNLD